MSRIKWDETGKRFYTTGVDRVAIYLKNTDSEGYGNAIAFNGVSSIEENPSGAESTPIYADNIKYLELVSKEDYGFSMTAYDYPDEFDACDGVATAAPGLKISQQTRRRFAIVWRSNIGNDTEGNDYGYAYHIVYNCKAGVSAKSHNTINDSPEATELSWDITTTDEIIENFKPSAKLTIYTRKLTEEKLKELEDTLFGSDDDATDGQLPLPNDLIRLLNGTPSNP